MDFFSIVYPLTTKWRRCGSSDLCHTLLLRHYDFLTVSYLAYWCLEGGGVSSAPICTLSCVNGAG
jgi:hypothetical protein